MKSEEIEKLRTVMGTNPKEKTPLITKFYEGVRGIKVELYDRPMNPYRAIFNMATATWGTEMNKWSKTTPEARYWVVKAVLEFRSLPNAMETSSFTFGVEGASRSSFDQVARARIGVVIGSMGWRDNDHSDIGFRVPQEIWNDKLACERFQRSCEEAKFNYHWLVSQGQASWQDARAFLPISACHSYTIAFNYMALRNFANKRQKFCEQSDTVATAWLIRERVKEVFPLLGSYLRPGCDNSHSCGYHSEYEMSEAFGCLFKECGRNPCKATDNYATFNKSCSDKRVIADQLGILIPNANEYLPPKSYEELSDIDKDYFNDL
jgi:thymidylate synthase ThyX